MAINEIVLHQGPDARSLTRLDIAVELAKTHDARIVGIYVKSGLPAADLDWIGFGSEQSAKVVSDLNDAYTKSERSFHARLAAEGIVGDWRLVEGVSQDALMFCARYGDLAVISQTDADESNSRAVAPEHIIIGSGGPVLVVPRAGDFRKIGTRIMIAWNGTREAARAVRDAMSLLQKAEKVIIYCISPKRRHPYVDNDIREYLARHGISAEMEEVVLSSESEAVSGTLKTVGGFGFQDQGSWTLSRHAAIGEIGVGDALLSAAADHAIDLLVMGAYGHTRIKELVLGGATRTILKTMTVPVVLSN